MTIQEQINQIIIRLNQISNNAKNINQLNPATSGEKWLGVFNEATNTTEKVNLNEITSQSGLPDGVVQLGSINLVDEEVTFTTGFTWRIDGVLYFNFEQVFEIPLAIDSRIDIFVLTDASTILRVAGVDNETPIAPAVPVGTIFLTQILVTDTTISPPVEPDLNGFVQKIFASFDKWATEEITLSLEGKTNFIASTALASFKGFNFPTPNDNFYEGKPFILFNNSGEDIVVEEDSADVDLPFLNGYTHENGKLILFVPVLGKLHMVGSVSNGGGNWGSITGILSDQTDLQSALDAKLEIVDTDDIVNHAVTNVKLAQMNANTVKGRLAGNGTPQDIAMADLPISTAQASVNDAKVDKAYIPITLTSNINVSTLEQNRVYAVNLNGSDRTIFIDEPTNILFIIASANTLFFDESGTQTLTALNDDLNVAGIGNSMLIENLGTNENFASKKGFTQINPSDYPLNLFPQPVTQRFLRDGIDSKAGIITSGFTGSPLIFDVAFTDFGTTNYTIQICGVDSRQWSYSLKTATGFRIHTNSSTALTGEVSWRADKI
jgi:hypothetical protein